jgi:hypothetical protein
VNTDESELALFRAERRVREIQAKLHRWADHDPQRDLWSARCPETGTAGAGGGSGKPTGGNTGRAPRADLTGSLVFRSFLALSPVRGSWGHAGDAWFVDLEG